MYQTKSGFKAKQDSNLDLLLDQVEVLDFDPISYQIALIGIQDNSCGSRKSKKKFGQTPEQDAKNLHFKKKRRENVVKSRKASKIYRQFTQWNI